MAHLSALDLFRLPIGFLTNLQAWYCSSWMKFALASQSDSLSQDGPKVRSVSVKRQPHMRPMNDNDNMTTMTKSY